MKGKVTRLRLSPNEEARIIREEYERRRKLRIQQVREQQRCIALKIRRDVERRRQHELEQLGKELRDEWEREQREKINRLQALYHESLQLLGQGQRSAKENEPDWAAIARREEENHTKAEERFREALKELKSQKLQDYERQSRSINARKKALETEKERAARVASLPLPPPNPIQNIDLKKPHRIRKSDVSAFATTYYHMTDTIVDRAVDQNQPNAHEEAEVELKRIQELELEEMRRREEQLEKAHLRGKQALRREHLVQDRERLLVELEHMQQTDWLRRRHQVATMPPQIFQPLCKRTEMKEDFQRQMEFAFEDMYTRERRVKGDLVVQLVPEPLPELSTGSQDQELDVTLDEDTPPVSENTQPEEGSVRTEEELSTQVEQVKPPPKHPLKKLLDRIRGQRDLQAGHGVAADLPNVITDEIPEKDTSIDTGSLTSAEKSIELPVEICRTTHHASETSEQSPEADTPFPDEQRRKHEDRKKRDEELEREKLEQLALLQELEEQKAQLEQMLLKSQQERQQPKVVVTHEEHQPESFTSDHEVSSTEASDLTICPDEDDHTCQIREYQHQLLERSRVHQRYVEVARQRLEEYQRALQMRYNMAAQVLPQHPPPLLGTRSSQVAAGLSHRTNSEVQTSSHGKAQTSKVIPAKESVAVREPCPPEIMSVPAAEAFLSNTSTQTTDISARLTEGILERVTERLRDRLTPLSVPSHLPNIPDPVQTVYPRITDLPVQTGTLPQDSVNTLPFGPTRDHTMRQREEQQEAELEQQEAELEQSCQAKARTWDMEEIRRQKRFLQALIHSDAQAEPVTEVTPEEHVSENADQVRRNLLESLLKAIEQRNGGTLSHLEDVQSDKGPASVSPQSSVLDEPLSPKGKTERLTPEPLDQRGPGDLEPEGKDQGWETDTEFSGQQPEMSQPVPEPAAEELFLEDVGQIRRRLFASLLKAIAEKNGETLSQSEASQREPEVASDRASVHPGGLLLPPQATRPPVTRVKSAVWEISQQHELSAIPEVETPVNTSLIEGLEDSLRLPSHGVDQDPLEGSDYLSLQTSCGQQILEKPTSSGSSSRLMWTERLLRSWESSPEGSVGAKTISPLSSDSGRGADYSGPAVTTFRSPAEACPEPDSLSTSTTISTGSYVTTDPEHHSDKSPTLVRVGPGAELLGVFSPPGESSCIKDSAAEAPHLAVERLFSHSGIQRIIDKYTKELNSSLCSPGSPTAGVRGSDTQAAGASATGQSAPLDLEKNERTGSSGAFGSMLSDDTAAPGNSLLESAAGPAQEQDSFRPLVGQSADQSSCLAADHRDSAMERLVGHPSAHSSLIGQLPGLFPVSLDHSGWDSTLTRMIGRLSHQSGSEQLTGCQGPGELQAPSEHVTTWLDGGQEESQMRPLVEELDESAGQQLESSGERTCVQVGGSDEVTVPSFPGFPPTVSFLDVTPQAQTVPTNLCPERTGVWDSFHPLMAEVTHNETAEPSMNFHLPGHSSPDQQPSSWDPGAPRSLTSDDSGGPERSLESFRAQEPVTSMTSLPASHESFSLLITSQDHVCDSALASPSLKVDPEPAALLEVTTCSGPPVVNVDPPEPVRGATVGEGSKVSSLLQRQDSADEKGILEQSQITLVSLTDTSEQDLEETLTDEAGPDEEMESTLPAQTYDRSPTRPATLLELDWGPSSSSQPDICQKKREALLQRSSQRVEELRARRAQSRRTRPETREQPQNRGCRPPAKCKAKVGPRPAQRSQTAADPGSSGHKTTQAEAPEDTRICTTEQRKLETSEMHQRTRRLYEQLEEVKQQKAVKSRQEASTLNRLKAKEFHKKTLQKLRAKQTPR